MASPAVKIDRSYIYISHENDICGPGLGRRPSHWLYYIIDHYQLEQKIVCYDSFIIIVKNELNKDLLRKQMRKQNCYKKGVLASLHFFGSSAIVAVVQFQCYVKQVVVVRECTVEKVL